MTIATEKLKPVSERYSLVRIAGSTYIPSTSQVVDDIVYDVKRDGVSMTRIDSAPSAGEWSFDEDTMTLTVNRTGGTYFIAYFYKFYTSSHDRRHYEDPEDSGTTERTWLGRLEDEIIIKRSTGGQTSGIITTSASQIRIVDSDFYEQQKNTFSSFSNTGVGFNIDVSYFNKPIDVWIVINDNIQKIGSGITSNISVDRDGITFSFSMPDVGFDNPAFLGDSLSDVYMPSSTTPNKFVFTTSSYDTKVQTPDLDLGGIGDAKFLDMSKTELGFLTSAAGPTYPYTLCRTDSGGIRTFSFGTITAASVLATATQKYTYHGTDRALLRIAATGGNILIGDSFSFTDPLFTGTQYAVITDLTGGFYYCMIMTQDTVATTTNVLSTISISSNTSPAIVLWDDSTSSPYLLSTGLDFTASSTITSYGNKIQKITTVSGFATATVGSLSGGTIHPGLGSLDTTNDKILFRVRAANFNTNPAGKQILESLGFVTTSTSDGFIPQIPYFTETTYGTVRSYLQDMIGGKAILVFQKANGDFRVAGLSGGTGQSTTLDDSIILDARYEIEYRDMANRIEYQVVHYPDTSSAENVTAHSYLNELFDTSKLKIATFKNYNFTANNRVVRNPTISISGSVSTEMVNYEIGDRIRIDSEHIFGGFSLSGTIGSATLLLTGLSIGPNRIDFEANLI